MPLQSPILNVLIQGCGFLKFFRKLPKLHVGVSLARCRV